MGQDRIGAPAAVDSYRPGAFEMRTFASAQDKAGRAGRAAKAGLQNAVAVEEDSSDFSDLPYQPYPPCLPSIVSALRRCREPVPARVAVSDGRPVRVTTDRRGFAGGSVVQAAGPWRTSGQWWGGCGHAPRASAARDAREASASGGGAPRESKESWPWSRDEWDVALSDGAVYRIFQDRETEAWFIDAIVD